METASQKQDHASKVRAAATQIINARAAAGRGSQSPTPTDPQKWRKIGRWLESGSGNGVLARAVIQTN